jgi:putative IMPACT (imprinted ancient) family translation regulator
MEEIKTIKNNISWEITRKKSKFIANLFYVETNEQAEEYINQIKKKYCDAKHNVIAYAIETNDNGIIVKYNDDRRAKRYSRKPNFKNFIRTRII